MMMWKPFVLPLSLSPLPYGPMSLKVFSAHEVIINLVKTPSLYSLMQKVRVELLIAASISFLRAIEEEELLLLLPW